ncbi:hypothetical protein ACFSUS_10335 [Spirosoma soli]|uniref:Uma2 family endonuclease n=1 Tax=Spirosoma soli TaxID=1770529 RepID=A0ABW5M1W7_9BACT
MGPRIHQRVIAQLISGLSPLYHNAVIKLEPLPETMLDEGRISQVPDVSLYNNETDQTPIVIEICHTNGMKDDVLKVIELIDADRYGIREGFIYNYKTQQWLRYRFGDNGVTEALSYSEILSLDLNQFL